MRAELAYLLGAYLSDGYLSWQGKDPHPRWKVRDEPFANCISIALSKIGSPYSLRHLASKEMWYVYERAGGNLGCWLWRVSGEKIRLPRIPRGLMRPLVAGLMDGDGSISRSSSGGFQLSFAGGKGFTRDFYLLLRSLRVKMGSPRRANGCYYWYMNIRSFLAAGLNFAMPRKQERLALWCCQMLQPTCRPGHMGWVGRERRTSVARWWMKEVWSKDVLVPVPKGCYTFKGGS